MQQVGGSAAAPAAATVEKTSEHALSSSATPSKSVSSVYDQSTSVMSAPLYGMTRVPARDRTAESIAPGGTAEVTFQIPSGRVFNFARSYLMYNLWVGDQGAGRYVWKYENTVPEIVRLDLSNPSGQTNLLGANNIGLQHANVWLKISALTKKKFGQFIQDESKDGTVYRSNVPASQNPLPVTCLGRTTSDTNYLDQQHLMCSPVAGNGGASGLGTGYLFKKMQIPLSSFAGTILAEDRNAPAFTEMLDFKVTFDPSKGFWSATSNLDPSANAAALIAGAAGPLAVGGPPGTFAIYLDRLELWLAEDTRPDVVSKARAEVKGDGSIFYVPTVHVKKQAYSGDTAPDNVRLSAANGLFARNWYHVVMPPTETLQNSFDHSNCGGAAANPAARLEPDSTSKVVTFHHELDTVQLESTDYRATEFEGKDYAAIEPSLRGGIILNRRMFYRNWFTMYSFLPQSPDLGMLGIKGLGGVDLISKERLLTWQGTLMGASVDGGTVTPPPQPLNHYNFVECIAAFRIGENGIARVIPPEIASMFPKK